MTEIEKMFENAGIKKLLYCDICKAQEHALGLCAETECEPFYPPFTAEKQLKLIEWFISNRWWLNWLLNIASLDKKLDFSLDEKLAKLVNRLWQSFDDQEKEEIRRILNE